MKKRYIAVAGAAALAVLGVACTGQQSGHSGHTSTVATHSPQAAASTPAAPAPVPSPNGTYQGSCDYTLSTSLSGADHLIGEIDLTNTGNIGTIVHTKITWPQEGAAPIVARKTVRVHAGQSAVARFHVAVPGTPVIDQLQSWQESHNFRSGCTYKATITGTFGKAH